MVLTWVPFMVIFPVFIDLNTNLMFSLYTVFVVYMYPAAFILFNVYFTVLPILEIVFSKNTNSSILSFLRVFLAKILLHNMSTCVWLVLNLHLTPLGIALYPLGVTLSIHFIFNCKSEADLWCCKQNGSVAVERKCIVVKNHFDSALKLNQIAPV